MNLSDLLNVTWSELIKKIYDNKSELINKKYIANSLN